VIIGRRPRRAADGLSAAFSQFMGLFALVLVPIGGAIALLVYAADRIW
jgi:hypothetical protein